MIGSLGSAGGITSGSLEDLMKLLVLVSDPAKAKAAAQELQGLIKELADKQVALAATMARAESDRKATDSLIKAIDAAKEANTKRVAELDERARAVEAAFARLATAQTEFKAERDRFESKAGTQQADLTTREQNVARREVLLKQAEQDVAAMRDDLQVRLDRIRAAAA